jgi:hypothetical protein
MQTSSRVIYIVTFLMQAGIAEPEETVCKHVSTATQVTAATFTHATVEELLEAVFSVGSKQRLYNKM